ncbi:MAG: hypothetical protein ACI4JA_08190 [Oscillospiraceae bacterium]
MSVNEKTANKVDLSTTKQNTKGSVTMDKSRLLDALSIIDDDCEKIRAVIAHLIDLYEVADSIAPTVLALKPEVFNSEPDTAEYNSFKFINAYEEIMTILQIVLDYVCKMRRVAKLQDQA